MTLSFDLQQRIFTAILFGGLVLGGLFLGPAAAIVILGSLCFFCTYEFTRILYKEGYSSGLISPLLTTFISTCLFIYLGISFSFTPNWEFVYYLIVIEVIFCIFLFIQMRRGRPYVIYFGSVIYSTIYITIPFALLIWMMNHHKEYQLQYLLAFLAIVWVNDVAAYLAGTTWGKTPLALKISPGKTWEGTIGGWISALIVGVIISFIITDYSLFEWIIAALIIAPIGTAGDLLESRFKRTLELKDSGHVLPGHGGFLDRMDATIFASPFMALLYLLFNL